MDIAAERAYSTPFVNSTLLPMLLLSLAQQKHTPDTAKSIQKEYDFIIVGAGSAGSVVASRLSEIPCVSVLLLEAGKPPPLLTEVPGISRLFRFTDIDYAYTTVPQRHTGDSLINNQVIWASGKTIGGSSVLHDIIVSRGNPKNYDQWEAEGAKGWGYKDVLPYFIRLEDNRDPEYVVNGFHGIGGPQTVHRPRYHAEYRDPIFQAAEALGYKVVDPSDPHTPTGFYDLQGPLRTGQLCSTAKGYLVPVENRKNLDILPNAMVRKVLIKNHQAVGVEFDFQNTTYVVKARREVIVSAGSVNTPKLLMLSGIGPKKELQRFKIPVIADLPVGKNLQDHPASFLFFLFKPEIPPVLAKISNPASIAQYIQNRTGPLASAEFVSASGFFENKYLIPKKKFPDHQIYFIELQNEVVAEFGIRPEVFARVFGPYEGRAYYACASSLLHPRSRGTVTLKSCDPYDAPVIDPNYFEDPKDIQDVVEGLKTCRQFGTHPAMQKSGSFPFETLVPNCEKYAGNEELYYWCLAKNIIITLSHSVGTARMGDPKDPRTVVDPYLRVLNVKGLRVVDASVMPLVPSGNSNIPTIMVAEKASDIIKSTINCHEDDEDPYKKVEEPGFYDKPQYYQDSHQELTGEPQWRKPPHSIKSGKPSSKVKSTHNYPEQDWEKHTVYPGSKPNTNYENANNIHENSLYTSSEYDPTHPRPNHYEKEGHSDEEEVSVWTEEPEYRPIKEEYQPIKSESSSNLKDSELCKKTDNTEPYAPKYRPKNAHYIKYLNKPKYFSKYRPTKADHITHVNELESHSNYLSDENPGSHENYEKKWTQNGFPDFPKEVDVHTTSEYIDPNLNLEKESGISDVSKGHHFKSYPVTEFHVGHDDPEPEFEDLMTDVPNESSFSKFHEIMSVPWDESERSKSSINYPEDFGPQLLQDVETRRFSQQKKSKVQNSKEKQHKSKFQIKRRKRAVLLQENVNYQTDTESNSNKENKWEEDSASWKLPKVTPWNKEIPNVNLWNKELLEATLLALRPTTNNSSGGTLISPTSSNRPQRPISGSSFTPTKGSNSFGNSQSSGDRENPLPPRLQNAQLVRDLLQSQDKESPIQPQLEIPTRLPENGMDASYIQNTGWKEHKVQPWNKEIPYVVPWNQEILQRIPLILGPNKNQSPISRLNRRLLRSKRNPN